MTIMQSIRRGFAKVLGARIKEDLLDDFDELEGPDGRLFRKLGQRGFRSAQRDLRSSMQDEQNKQAFKSFIENPLIRRMAKMSAEFTIGNGITVVSKNEAVQRELDEWWHDPVNDLDKKHYTLALELGLYGELIGERIVNQFTGRHRYNWLDPLFIANVIPHAKFPTIPSKIAFWDSGIHAGGKTIIAKILNGVPEEEMLTSFNSAPDHPMIFYFAANRLSGALRGHSNFYPLIEWADLLDQASFTMGERMVLMLMFVWHLKAEGMDEKQKKQFRKLLEEANPGSALVTDMKKELTSVSPDLKSADFTEGAKFIRTLIAGSAGIPEHFLGDGGDTNLATATAMNLPTLRSFLQQQREFVCVIRTLARSNLVSVAKKGRIPIDEVDNFTVQVDPISPQDVGTTATALQTAVTSLSAAKLEGWVSDNEARQVIRNIIGGIAELEEDIPDQQPEDVFSPEVMAAMRRGFGELQSDAPSNGNGSGSAAT